MVHRSGATVYLNNATTGTLIKIPATTATQTLSFSDVTLELSIINNKVMLGGQEITTTGIQF
jgi:hypothetical protein